jgi:dolichol-phosphate mannosyltransferase
MSRAVNTYARWLLGLSPRDCSGAYRCYRTQVLKRINFDEICSRGYSFQEEILWQIKRHGGRFAETPITFADRERGHSKINTQEALEALRVILVLGIKNLFTSPRTLPQN